MENKLISFIIPVYNAEQFIEKLINNLKLINHCEIICVDDGSTDNSFQLLSQLQRDISQLIVIHQNNQGVSAARNTGIKIAKGKYISFIDADDSINIDNLKEVINLIDDSDLVFFGISDYFIYSENNVKMIHGYKDNKVITSDEFINSLGYYLNQMIIYSPCNKFYKREIILQNNICFDKKFALGEDALFNVDFFKYMKTVQFTPFDVYIYNHYYNRKDTGSTKYVPNEMEIAIYVYEHIFELVEFYQANSINNMKHIHQFIVRRISTLINGVHCSNSPLTEKQKYNFTNRIYAEQILVEAIKDYQIKMVGKKDELLLFLLRHKLRLAMYIIYKINNGLKSR